MVIIGFGYQAQQGKDTAAQAIIAARLGAFDVRRYAFADPLKREINAEAEKAGGMFNLFQNLSMHGAPLPNGKNLFLPTWVEYEHNPLMTDPLCPLGKQRKLLQWWGTEYRRLSCDRFYWVKRIAEQVKEETPQVALLTDVRFQNEFLWVKSNAGTMVKVSRLGFSSLKLNSGHTSEHELDGAPFDIDITVNDGEIEQLKSDAVTVFDMVIAAQSPAGFEIKKAA